MKAEPFVAADDEPVLIKTGDVTTISGEPSAGAGDDGMATGGEAIAASLSPDRDVLNVAFFTGAGGVQIVQLRVADLTRTRTIAGGGGVASDGLAVVPGELTALSGEVISNGRGAATSVGSVAVAAGVDGRGELNLSFVDGDGDLQLIQTNVAELLPTATAGDDADATTQSEPS